MTLFLEQSHSVNGHAEVECVILLMCCHVFPLQLSGAANARMLTIHHSELTLKLNVSLKILTFHRKRTTYVGTWEKLLLTYFIVLLLYSCVRALFPTVFTLVVPIWASSQVLVQILPHEGLHFTFLVFTLVRAWDWSDLALSEVVVQRTNRSNPMALIPLITIVTFHTEGPDFSFT